MLRARGKGEVEMLNDLKKIDRVKTCVLTVWYTCDIDAPSSNVSADKESHFPFLKKKKMCHGLI